MDMDTFVIEYSCVITDNSTHDCYLTGNSLPLPFNTKE